MTQESTVDSTVRGGCLICAIAAGRCPAHIVHRSDRLVAFLDSAPIRPGHLQIVPRAHLAHFNALPTDLAGALLDLGQCLAAVQRSVLKVDRVGFLFPAAKTGHAGVHVVPLLTAGDIVARGALAAQRDRPQPTAAELEATAAALRDGLAVAA